MHFEAHFTIHVPRESVVQRVAAGWKLLQIVVPSGALPFQPMLSCRFSASNAAAASIAFAARQREVEAMGFAVRRGKLESEIQEAATPSRILYLEQHVKIGSDLPFADLLAIAAAHGGHLSRNERVAVGNASRFITQRFAADQEVQAKHALAALIFDLAQARTPVLDVEREQVHIDTDLSLDEGWRNETLERDWSADGIV